MLLTFKVNCDSNKGSGVCRHANEIFTLDGWGSEAPRGSSDVPSPVFIPLWAYLILPG